MISFNEAEEEVAERSGRISESPMFPLSKPYLGKLDNCGSWTTPERAQGNVLTATRLPCALLGSLKPRAVIASTKSFSPVANTLA